jgi:putative ATP-binding cassette transporter
MATTQVFPWGRLYRVGKLFWLSERKLTGLAHLAGVLTLLFVNAKIAVFISDTASAFMTSIEQRSVPLFYHYLMVYALALVLITPVKVFYSYLRTRLALVWRSWLSNQLFTWYFANHAYYQLNDHRDIDNPDQRMSQDVDTFCNSAVGLFISIIDSTVNASLFIIVLWRISEELSFTVLGYAAAGSVIAVYIGKALVGLNFNQMKTEADLRFSLAEVRRESEAIAIYNGERLAEEQARSGLKRVIDTLMSVMNVNRNLQFFTEMYNGLVPLIPVAIIAPLYLNHELEFGKITQATMAFQAIFAGATFMIAQFGGISSFAANLNRLGSFVETLEALNEPLPASGKHLEMFEGAHIAFVDVTLLRPDGTLPLIENLTVDVEPGGSLLITGPQASGKTALLRAIAGLWTLGTGKLFRPKFCDRMFISQQPYLPVSTLRNCLADPASGVMIDDAKLLQILKMVKLPDLAVRTGGLDTVQNWRELLSVSEKQKLALARIIVAKPKYVIIDYANSAMEEDEERLLYAVLATICATVISVGHADTLVHFHSKVLELSGDGGWKVYPASEYKPSEPAPAPTAAPPVLSPAPSR